MARPQWQEGSLTTRETKSGKVWWGAWRVYIYRDGKRVETKRRKVLGLCGPVTWKEALAKLRTYIAESTGQVRGVATLQAAWVRYRSANEASWSKGHADTMAYAMKRVLADWGTWEIDRIDRARLQAWFDSLELARPTVEKMLVGTRVAIKWAVDDGLATRNPAGLVRLHQAHSVREPALTVDQVKALLAAAKDQRDHLIIRLMVQGGLRPSEVAALRVGSLDHAKRRIEITEAAPKEGLKTTKTKSSAAWLPVSESLADEYRQYAEYLGGDPEQRMFPGTTRETLRMEAWRRRTFDAICKRAGVECDLRALRRTAATLLGGNPKVAQEVLRHAKPDITATVYQRAEHQDVRTAVEGLDAKLGHSRDTGKKPVSRK